jgi:hypothetical protein
MPILRPLLKVTVKHQNFISYYHSDDEAYRGLFENFCGNLFVNQSLNSDEIDPDNSTAYVKRLIFGNYITDSSVVIVLVGANTKKRKHIDWEISAGLNQKVGGYSGLLGILLPTFPVTAEGKYLYDNLPPRLAANVKTGYAVIYKWGWIAQHNDRIRSAIDAAFNRRKDNCDLIDNSLPLFVNNRA